MFESFLEGVVAERILRKLHEVLLQLTHDQILLICIFYLGDQGLYYTKTEVRCGCFKEVLVDFFKDVLSFFIRETLYDVLNDMCSLWIVWEFKYMTSYGPFKIFLFFFEIHEINEFLNRVGTLFIAADKHKLWLNLL